MGVSKDEVVVHLAMLGTACSAVEVLLRLDTSVDMLRESEFGGLEAAVGGDFVVTVWVLVATLGLVTALLVTNFSAMLETAELEAAEELVEAVVLVGEVAAELVAALRAWNSAALLLSFNLFFSLFLLVGDEFLGAGGEGWGMR